MKNLDRLFKNQNYFWLTFITEVIFVRTSGFISTLHCLVFKEHVCAFQRPPLFATLIYVITSYPLCQHIFFNFFGVSCHRYRRLIYINIINFIVSTPFCKQLYYIPSPCFYAKGAKACVLAFAPLSYCLELHIKLHSIHIILYLAGACFNCRIILFII